MKTLLIVFCAHICVSESKQNNSIVLEKQKDEFEELSIFKSNFPIRFVICIDNDTINLNGNKSDLLNKRFSNSELSEDIERKLGEDEASVSENKQQGEEEGIGMNVFLKL